MNEDSFHATVKLVTGEEILTEIIECEENGQDFFLFHNPIIITENNHVDMQVVYRQHIISISELDKFGVEFYRKALVAAVASTPIKRKVDTKRHSGYVGKIEAFRTRLEKMFTDSPDIPKEPKE